MRSGYSLQPTMQSRLPRDSHDPGPEGSSFTRNARNSQEPKNYQNIGGTDNHNLFIQSAGMERLVPKKNPASIKLDQLNS